MMLNMTYGQTESQGGKWLTQVHLERWPLNRRVCVCVCVCHLHKLAVNPSNNLKPG